MQHEKDLEHARLQQQDATLKWQQAQAITDREHNARMHAEQLDLNARLQADQVRIATQELEVKRLQANAQITRNDRDQQRDREQADARESIVE